ncbi:sodium:glutamate symporter [Waterburya agarophytonicola K14]|uniref:Sodium:glutamate symporter n=1 Tax=Waterburya agarophytonicola KI4 TaxID=2874699 RepID=A0A964FHD7_9CYAN|nr:sodium/glutamate symporter [Waterburya agarophytonicola]MCC0178977.1 sodium:glutamate symporter [Waterburya agarophytonicola KI4]
MFNLLNVLFAFIVVGIFLLIARIIKHKIRLFQTLYIPESIIAGAIALLLGTGALGAIAVSLGASPDSYIAGGLFPEEMRTVWSQAPGVFINIVFAALFLGEHIPNPKEIWRKTAPQVAFGQTLAWGQYVLGILVTLLILTPVFGINPIAGALIEIGFEGGHGTAGGMANTLTDLGFAEGGDLALGLATVGIVSGIIFGTVLAHWGRQKGYIQAEPVAVEEGDAQFQETAPTESGRVLAKRSQLMQNFLIDPLSLNFGFTGLAIAIGWIILQVLTLIESATWGRGGLELIGAVPLFPMALIGGIIIQVVMKRLDLDVLIIRRLQERIAGVALDLLVVTALASINLAVLGANIGVFLTLSIVGIAWNVLAFMYLAPRILPIYWFERGVGDMGQSMGVTATGILLIRMVDPENRTGAFESFAYKQLFFEPIVGGGLFTAAAPALIVRFGSIPILFLTAGLLVFWLVFGIINCKRTSKKLQEERATAELQTTA